MNNQSHNDLLTFEAPTADAKGWETAEAQAFRFPQRYITKCQEFNDYARGLAALEQEKNQLFGFVVRNLVSAMDTLQFVADEVGSDDAVSSVIEDDDAYGANGEGTDPDEETDPFDGIAKSDDANPERPDDLTETAEDSPDAELTDAEPIAEDEATITRRGLESVGRSISNILEGLHIEQVDLLGKTYRRVEVNGRLVEDPFEIVEARTQGKATELPVLEIITSLWVQTEPGLRVIRKGQVIC